MTDLYSEQSWFASIITAPMGPVDATSLPIYPQHLIEEIEQQIAPSPTLSSAERIGIYQQQYWWRLITVVQELFPSLVALFDYPDFNRQIAIPYLTQYPPRDWSLSRTGNELPGWIERFYREKDAPLVLQLAKLDLANEQLKFVPIHPPIKPSDSAKKKIYLQPFVRLFAMRSDLFSFRDQLLQRPPAYWAANPFPPLTKSDGKRYFILYRFEEKNQYEETTAERFKVLACMEKGAKLNELVILLEECGDIVSWFQQLAARSWLTDLRDPDRSIKKKSGSENWPEHAH